jgi:hypothetical protein
MIHVLPGLTGRMTVHTGYSNAVPRINRTDSGDESA